MKQEKNRRTLERFLPMQVRAVEEGEDNRVFELSFSSEEPYMRWFGSEILDHSGEACDLSRLQELGVVLFNHDRNAVLGKITRAWIEDNRGKAEIAFDDDEFAETIRKKVAGGTLRGVSVGYRVDSWEEVTAGGTSADGRFTGPCSIARRWLPYEVSIVSVPADATVGVGRELESEQHSAVSLCERQLQINKNHFKEELNT